MLVRLTRYPTDRDRKAYRDSRGIRGGAAEGYRSVAPGGASLERSGPSVTS